LQDRNQSFVLDSFMLVLGILLGTFISLIFIVSRMAIDSGHHLAVEDPEVAEAIASRIAPVGSVILMGSDELAAAEAARAAAAPAQPTGPRTGDQVYNESCFACHAAPGVGGAPVTGDGDAWAARVAQGRELMIEHAINGYEGSAGLMPAKGGRLDFSDDEVIAAVDYILAQLGE